MRDEQVQSAPISRMRHSGSSQSTFLWQPTHHLWGLKWLKSRTSSNISCILAIFWSFWRAAHISTFFSGLAFLRASFSCFSAWGCEGAGGETVAANTWGQLGFQSSDFGLIRGFVIALIKLISANWTTQGCVAPRSSLPATWGDIREINNSSWSPNAPNHP